MDTDLLTVAEAAEALRMTPGNLAQLRYKGGGPVYRRLTPRKIVYRRSDLEAWVDGTAHTRTDQPVAVSA